jgi:phosphoribosyl 1,2-cyclic phosphodiesterase
LCIDAGTGFRPLALTALPEGRTRWEVLQTHWHHDHTQGMLIAPPIYMPSIHLHISGPVDSGMGPREVYRALLQPPLHPVSLDRVESHMSFTVLDPSGGQRLAYHPKGGIADVLPAGPGGISFGPLGTFPPDECLIVRTFPTHHPQKTLMFRFDEGPTGNSFAFMTDEEERVTIPTEMEKFLDGLDLLIADCQYTDLEYSTGGKAGFGHGTPSSISRIARLVRPATLGLTHHDPNRSDADVERILDDCKRRIDDGKTRVIACFDGLTITL